jgi:HEPN domain-containing protein
MNESLVQKWLDKAAEDLVVAQLVQQEGHLSHACFLSQQTIEKSLKAFLLAYTGHHPRTHKLIDLLQQCLVWESGFDQFRADCIRVDQFYIPVRYPDGIPGGLPDGQPNANQTQNALDAAQMMHDFVKVRLQSQQQKESSDDAE